MKTKLIVSLMMVLFGVSSYAQVMTVCSPEQLKAVENRRLASQIQVVNTASQQLQCYYQQLATYYQQLDKDNQQKAKDLQQIAKDKQQMETDARQIAMDKVLSERAACLDTVGSGYDEVVCFIENILPLIPDSCTQIKNDLKKVHKNRCDSRNGYKPFDFGNIRGFDNHCYVIAR